MDLPRRAIEFRPAGNQPKNGRPGLPTSAGTMHGYYEEFLNWILLWQAEPARPQNQEEHIKHHE